MNGFKYKDECLLYPKGRISFRGKTWHARRLLYGWFVGNLEELHQIKVTCSNQRCVNPLHLKEHLRKTDPKKIKEFLDDKDRAKMTQKELQEKYGIPISRIQKLERGICPKSLTSLPIEEKRKENKQENFSFLVPSFLVMPTTKP
jgi:hypothetical protein